MILRAPALLRCALAASESLKSLCFNTGPLDRTLRKSSFIMRAQFSSAARGSKDFDEVDAKRYQGQRGRDKIGANRCTKWYDISTNKDTGEPSFKLKSACLSDANYHKDLPKVAPWLRTKGWVIPDVTPEATPLQLAAALLWRRHHSSESNWKEFIQPCPFKRDIENINVENLNDVAAYIQEYAEARHWEKRGNAKERQQGIEQQHVLKRCQGFCIGRRCAEGDAGCQWLQQLATYFQAERSSMTSHYVFEHDYSNVCKDHTIGTNIFFVDDFCDYAITEERQDLYLELCYYPMPMQVAETNPTAAKCEYAATKQSTTAAINNSVNVFGHATTKNIMRKPAATIDDIDLDTWALPEEVRNNPELLQLVWHILCDQGSPELRMIQLIFEFFPGVPRDPWCHRLSNNTKGVIEPLLKGAAASRSFFMGPFGSGGNQGKLRNSARMLAREAKIDPQKTATRYGAGRVIDAYPNMSMEEILDKCVQKIITGTDARWESARDHNEAMKKYSALLLFILEPLVQQEKKKKKKNELLAEAEEADEDWDPLWDDGEGHIELPPPGENEATPECLGKEWDGSATEFKKVLLEATPEVRAAQEDICTSHSDLFDLLMALQSKHGEDPELLENEKTLARAQKYLDPKLQKGSTLTTPEIQRLISKNRGNIWNNITADIGRNMGKSSAHLAGGLKLLSRTANAHAFQMWDPLWGMWETIANASASGQVPSEELLRNALAAASFRLSVFAKRAAACVIQGKLPHLRRQCDLTNISFPITEYEQETQFKTPLLQKAWIAADANKFSKELDRLRRSERHTKYFAAPQVGRMDRTNQCDPDDITSPRNASLVSSCSTSTDSSRLGLMMKDSQTRAASKVKTKEEFWNSRFTDLKQNLVNAMNGDQEREWPQEFKDVVEHVGSRKIQTSAPNTIGLRGVEFKALLKNGYHPLKVRLLQSCGRLFWERKNIKERIRTQGGVLMRLKEHHFWVPYGGNGYIYQSTMSPSAQNPNHMTFRPTPEFTRLDADFFAKCDLYDGELQTSDNYKDRVFFVIDPSKWVRSIDMQIAYFASATEEVQAHMLLPLVDKCPQLSEEILKRMTNFGRKRLFTEMELGNEVPTNILNYIFEKYAPRMVVHGIDGEEFDSKMHDEKMAKLAAKAGKENGPQQMKARTEQAVHSPGRTRRSPTILLSIYRMTGGREPKVVATCRSHRVEQGAKPDVLRLYWEDGYVPCKVHQFPETPVGTNPIKSAESVFVPRLAKEFDVDPRHLFTFRDDDIDECEDFCVGQTYESKKPSPKPKRQKKGKTD